MNKYQQKLLFSQDKRKGYTCDCCGQFVKIYSRSFNSNMALALLMLYKNRHKGFLHLEDLMKSEGYKRCGDASYLQHYYLIEPLKEKREDGSKRNGCYRITGRGILFCEKNLLVQERFLIFNNKIQGFEGSEIDIEKALGTKFSYDKLMS
jgi:hypothetical protein